MIRFALLSLAVLGVALSIAKADDRPNLVFLMSDDQATYSMGCYGTPGAKTPHLDQLARDGLIFDNHYVTTAICMASRATAMTGMVEYKTGCNFEHGPMMQSTWSKSYPMLLRAAGYTTGFAGKFGFEVQGDAKKPRLPEEDFDRWGGGPGQTSYDTAKNASMAKYAKEYPHSTLSYGAFGSDFIRDSATGDQPFCLSISFKAPHQPVQPDPKFDDVYQGATFTKPDNYGRESGEHLSLQSRQGRQYERFHSWGYADNYDAVMAKYYQQIYAIDVAVGMIRSALTDAGVAGNTVVIYTSDNGFMNGSHGYGSKVIPYEESTRVPLIVFDPRHPNSGKQIRCDALTGNVDFAPTILALAGLDAPANVDGADLMKLYDDPKARIHQSLPLINVWGPKKVHSFGVVTKNWKYIFWPYDDGEFEKTEELFDTQSDPGEMKNLAAVTTATTELKRMRRLYDKAVQRWKKDAVPYNNYQSFADVFRRQSSIDHDSSED
ncbi:MAG: sulfatase [Pirellulaceae bacterium]|nr:sulfatase [Pirellulaceae bacterium]